MTARDLVVERLPRRTPPAPAAPLPEPVRSALGSIADDLRHAPRDVFLDRAELVLWLNRLARRVDGVVEMTTLVAGKSPSTPRPRYGNPHSGRKATSREVAEAVFGKALSAPTASAARPKTCEADAVFGPSTPTRSSKPRTITNRKGKPVQVEVRRRRHDVPAQITMEV